MVEVRVSDIEQYCTKEFAKLSKCFDKTQDENKCKKSVTPLQECTKKFIDNVKFITTKCENPFYDYKYSIKKKESEEKTNPLFESLWECMKKNQKK
ncbi:coiled-coil-helix-coiled-coil-helix domain-containing protein [Anaeramoeba flamelloides]|uniref:Coiled-coil-helix-coiled-coil-helix domain-containing protein n=1 Tax=Anaeramoeba flamelloides TaxID=1746091 RepID=A0ABQ8ZCJ7_9EUKA|nr:coiled-coil-helix-coiled-coil-helix domain-containing protein [Anaeramoeba flamelloides]